MSMLLGELAATVSDALLGADILYPVSIARLGGSTVTGSGYVGSADQLKDSIADAAKSEQMGRKVVVLANSLSAAPKFGDVVSAARHASLIVANRPTLDPAGATWTLYCLEREAKAVRLVPPPGTGGEYDEDAMVKDTGGAAPVGPIPALLRDITADEIMAGVGAGRWLAADVVNTGVAIFEVPGGVSLDSSWQIEVDSVARPIRALALDQSLAKVFYA